MWYIPTVEYYSIITRKEVQIHVIAWVIFADSVLSKRIQNTKLCFCLYEMSLRGKFTDVEYRLLVTSSWGEGKNSEWPFIEYESESVNHSVVSDSVIPWTAALQVPPSMEFSRQEYWSRVPFPSPGVFLTQGSNPGLLHCRQILYCLSWLSFQADENILELDGDDGYTIFWMYPKPLDCVFKIVKIL